MQRIETILATAITIFALISVYSYNLEYVNRYDQAEFQIERLLSALAVVKTEVEMEIIWEELLGTKGVHGLIRPMPS